MPLKCADCGEPVHLTTHDGCVISEVPDGFNDRRMKTRVIHRCHTCFATLPEKADQQQQHDDPPDRR